MAVKPSYEELEHKVKELQKVGLKYEKTREELHKTRRHHERLVNTIPCAIYEYIRWPDGRSQFIYISPQCKNIFGHDADSIMNNSVSLMDMVHEDDVERLKSEDETANLAGVSFQSEVRILPPDGKIKWIQLTSRPSNQKMDMQTIWTGVIQDITPRKIAEEHRNNLLEKLQKALTEVRTLKGIIPICSYCKKIRDDKGYWNLIESYIQEHSEAEFSHGMCPDCCEELYGNEDWYIKMKKHKTPK